MNKAASDVPFLSLRTLLLCSVLFLASIDPVRRSSGWDLVAVYAALYAVLAIVLNRYPPQQARWLMLPLALAVIIWGVLRTPSPLALEGSDRNEALTLATARLLSGADPYAERTSLGYPITPLPGGLFLNAPMVLLTGNAGYMNVVWLVALLLVLDIRGLGIFMALLVAPYTRYQIRLGEDLLANGVALGLGLWLIQRYYVLGAGLLGLALAWRANALALLPSLLVARRAWVAPAAVAVAVAVTLPWYVTNPAGFAPLHITGRVSDSMQPILFVLLFALIALAGMVAAWRSPAQLLGICGAVLAGQVVLTFALNSLASGTLRWGTLGYLILTAPCIMLWTVGTSAEREDLQMSLATVAT